MKFGKRTVFMAEPSGGLGNRLICINNLLSLSEKFSELCIYIVWWKEPECGCKYQDIFKTTFGMPVYNLSRAMKRKGDYIEEKKYGRAVGALLQTAFFKMYCFITRNHRINDIWCRKSDLSEKELIDEIKSFKTGSIIFSRLDASYCANCRITEDCFSNEVVRKVNKVKELFCGKRYIGLHIRRTDHKMAIQNSPLEFFKEAVKREKSMKEDVFFYLATDEQSVIDELLKLYGDSIIVNKEGEKGRASSRAIQDAAVDLLVLAGAEKIYGSMGSTFSAMVAQIGKKPLILHMR